MKKNSQNFQFKVEKPFIACMVIINKYISDTEKTRNFTVKSVELGNISLYHFV